MLPFLQQARVFTLFCPHNNFEELFDDSQGFGFWQEICTHFSSFSSPPTVCEDCRLYFRESCPQHGAPTFIADSPVPERILSRALLSLPDGLVVKERPEGGLGVWSTLPALPRGCLFGPFEGEVVREHGNCTRYSWAVRLPQIRSFLLYIT